MVFGWSPLGLEPTIYRTRGEHANHFATDAVLKNGKTKQQNIIPEMISISFLIGTRNRIINIQNHQNAPPYGINSK
jgi:hypothetical protein